MLIGMRITQVKFSNLEVNQDVPIMDADSATEDC